MRFIALFLVLLLAHGTIGRQVDYCYADDDDPYLYLGTKTSYHFVHGGKTRYQPVPDCKPVQLWMLSRHGARYPKLETITQLLTLPKFRDQIVHNHEHRGDGHLCDQDLDNLKLWNPNPNLTPEMAARLTPGGAEDSILFARRLQGNFPELLQPNSADITPQHYKFRSTNTERTRASMEAFMQGLFGSKDAVRPVETPSGQDNLLKSYKNCTQWYDGMGDDTTSIEEYDKFLDGPEMSNVVQNISRRLGFRYTLSVATVRSMYDMCRFEKAWAIGKVSAWCAPFTKEELRVLEYSEDIYYNYAAGNGRKINERLGCSSLQDMFNNFKQLERGNSTDKPRGIFYFAHTRMLLNFFTSMGIGSDPEPLLSTNFRQMAKRRFRTSLIGPFNTNLVAVFYRCNYSDGPNKVMFYLEEKPLLLEGCRVGLCDWEYLKNKFGSLAFDCDPNLCGNGNGASFLYAWSTIKVSLPIFSLIATQLWNRLYREAILI